MSSGEIQIAIIFANAHWRQGIGVGMIGCTVNSIKLETGLRPNSAGIPYT